MQEVVNAIYTYIFSGEYPQWTGKCECLVEHNIAIFTEDGVVKINEPLVIINAIIHFQEKHEVIRDMIPAHLAEENGDALRAPILWGIAKLFRSAVDICTVFAFSRWYFLRSSKCTAQIVVRTASGTWGNFDITAGQLAETSEGVLYLARTLDDVCNWIRDGTTGWCFVDKVMDAILMTRLRLSVGSFLLVLFYIDILPSSTCYSLVYYRPQTISDPDLIILSLDLKG